MKNFILDCLNGDALIDDLDEYIDYWHEKANDLNVSLKDFLGMTEKEYNYFLKDEDYLADIIYAHEHNIDIDIVLEAINDIPLAARAEKADEINKIQTWIKKIKDE